MLGKRLSFLRCRKTLDIADPLYLFACYLEWHRGRSLAAYQTSSQRSTIQTKGFGLWPKRSCSAIRPDRL